LAGKLAGEFAAGSWRNERVVRSVKNPSSVLKKPHLIFRQLGVKKVYSGKFGRGVFRDVRTRLDGKGRGAHGAGN
jgi:hypothetical protein